MGCVFFFSTIHSVTAQQKGNQSSGLARYATTCPSGYSFTRAGVESTINGRLGDEIRAEFGPGSLMIDGRLKLLIDSEDREICEFLNRLYQPLIDAMYQPFSDVEPEFNYAVSYFGAGDFYFVMVEPVQLIRADPETGKERIQIGQVGGVSVYRKDTLEQVATKGHLLTTSERKRANRLLNSRYGQFQRQIINPD